MLDPRDELSTPRWLKARRMVDITSSRATSCRRVRSRRAAGLGALGHPQTNLGQANLTTFFTGWSDTGGRDDAARLQTRLDWRNIDFFKLYVDAYETTPTSPTSRHRPRCATRRSRRPMPSSRRRPRRRQGRLANQQRHHGYRVQRSPGALRTGYNSRGQAKAVIDHARFSRRASRYPPIVSHHHFDHTAGLREAVAEGLTVVQRPASRSIFSEMVAHRRARFSRRAFAEPATLEILPVDEHLQLTDATQALDVYWGRTTPTWQTCCSPTRPRRRS